MRCERVGAWVNVGVWEESRGEEEASRGGRWAIAAREEEAEALVAAGAWVGR